MWMLAFVTSLTVSYWTDNFDTYNDCLRAKVIIERRYPRKDGKLSCEAKT